MSTYVNAIKSIYETKQATEKTYRKALYPLFEPHTFIEETKKEEDSMPDGKLLDAKGRELVVVETKDYGVDLSAKKHQKQFDKYKKQYPKLIITNYKDFEFYQGFTQVAKFTLFDDAFTLNQEEYNSFIAFYKSFAVNPIKYTDPVRLAQELAMHTRALREDIKTLRANFPDNPFNLEQKFIQEKLLPSITEDEFANLYAQTITYAFFSTRYYNPNDDFDPTDPITNNKLIEGFYENILNPKKRTDDVGLLKEYKKLHVHVAAIGEVLANTDMYALTKALAKTSTDDLIIHFYETFLTEYDPKVKKDLGVWYTPEPVVDFMVRGVDELLKGKLGVKKGLLDKGVHVLDPATGTGNYLNGVIKYIHKQHGEPATWSKYVKEVLIPRLNGFELLMTSYSIAHLKLTNTLKETGFTGDAKLNIFLTNTLEKPLEVKGASGDAFSTFLKALNVESNGADAVKTNKDIKVIIGNPPYNAESKNQSEFITDMMKPYAVKGSGSALNDDYIKFIRYAENLIDQNGSGVVAYITNNSFLSGAKTYGMRQSLLKTFDEIYVLDFTFSSKWRQEKKEDRIFSDVQTPVCITFFLKSGRKKNDELAQVFYKSLNATRTEKFQYCNTGELLSGEYQTISLIAPQYYFFPQEASTHEEYCKNSFQLGEDIFHVKSTGILTSCDSLVIDPRETPLKAKVNAYLQKKERPDGVSETVFTRGKGLSKIEQGTLMRMAYRPFDTQHYFESSLTSSRAERLVKQAKAHNQLFLITARIRDNNDFKHIYLSKEIGEKHFFSGRDNIYYLPLYQYHAPDFLNPEGSQSTNFKDEFLKTFGESIGMSFQDAPELITPSTFSSLNVFDYIYGVLHDKDYRTKYKAFLKSDYPRVPYPKTQEEFLAYVTKGQEFRELHLSEGEGWEDDIKLGGTGGGEVKPSYDKGILNLTPTLSIDLTQEEWEFKIGGCPVISSWLEQREGLELTQKELNEFKRLVVRVRKHIELLGK